MPVGVGIGGAVLGAGSSLISSSNAADAQQQATAAQTAANQAALAEQRREFDTQQQNLAPWLSAGTSALGAQSNLLGLNGNGTQQSAIDSLQGSPLYQSLYKTGQNMVLNNAAATGGLRGGNATSSLYDLGQSTLASVIQNQLANLGGLSGTGQSSATSLNSSGSNSANAISQLLQQQGSITGGGILGSTAAGNAGLTGVSQSLTNLFSNPSILNALGGNSLNASTLNTIASNPSIF